MLMAVGHVRGSLSKGWRFASPACQRRVRSFQARLSERVGGEPGVGAWGVARRRSRRGDGREWEMDASAAAGFWGDVATADATRPKPRSE